MNLRQLSEQVEAFFDWLSRCAAPCMPWLFLSLRRALIATVIAVLVAVLFFMVPQSREVLHGLGEPPLQSLRDFNATTAKNINFLPLMAYVLTALALGFATWYSARLLVTVEAKAATPLALAEGVSADRLRIATTWLPRGLGVFVLGAAMGAFIFANYTPALSRWQALALVAFSLAPPVVVVAGALRVHRGLLGLGIVLMIASAALLFWLDPGRWLIGLWSLFCASLPATFLLFLVERRKALEHFGAARSPESYQARGFGQVMVTLFVIVAGSIVLLLLLALLPTTAVRQVGSAASVLLFLAAAALLSTGLHILVRHAATNVPGLTTFVLVAVSVVVALVGTESLGDEKLSLPARAAVPAALHPAAAEAPALVTAERPFYVNAYGGGLRAATFTAQLLARVDDASCGEFGEEVAAFSGVSGGSLGIATYLIARQELKQRNGWSDCLPGVPSDKTPLTDIVVRTLVQDHLSPAVARMLAVDAPHLPWWSPTRGQALLDSWQSALVNSLAQGRPDQKDSIAAFAQPLAALTGGMKQPVAVYFNSTDADSGNVVRFSSRHAGKLGTSAPFDRQVDLSVGQAVLHSARFPVVSPAGGLEGRRLVDGGYADNSGTLTLRRAFETDRPHGNATARLLNINGNPPERSECYEAAGNPPILTGLRALLQVRGAHATLAAEQLEEAMNGAPAMHLTLDLEQTPSLQKLDQAERCRRVLRAHQAPLGWYMSYTAALTMSESVEQRAAQICATLARPCTLQPMVAGP